MLYVYIYIYLELVDEVYFNQPTKKQFTDDQLAEIHASLCLSGATQKEVAFGYD